MPLPPGPAPKHYLILHLVTHGKLLKKCSEEWYWGSNWAKFFHSCDIVGHQLEVHEYNVLGCYHCGKQLPDSLKSIQNLQKLKNKI